MLAKLACKRVALFSNIRVPTIDLTNYIYKRSGWEDDCKKTADLIRQYGLAYAYDPRIDHNKNEVFLDQMEKYFELRSQQFEKGIRNLDVSSREIPLGLKFSHHEKMVPFIEEKAKLKDPHKSLTPITQKLDPTWRFHHSLNGQFNFDPKQFPNFKATMSNWGKELYGAGNIIAQMTAIGLGLPFNALSRTIQNGMLYLSPPAIDLNKSKVGDIITGFHRDWTLFTVHGKARYPGLFAWLLTGEKFAVQLPKDHILVQSGRQLQWLTGGYLKAGFHEVIHTKEVEARKQQRYKQGKSPWRIASTMFCHVQGDLTIEPFDKFRSPEIDKLYPSLTATQYLLKEFRETYPNDYQQR